MTLLNATSKNQTKRLRANTNQAKFVVTFNIYIHAVFQSPFVSDSGFQNVSCANVERISLAQINSRARLVDINDFRIRIFRRFCCTYYIIFTLNLMEMGNLVLTFERSGNHSQHDDSKSCFFLHGRKSY